MKALFDATGGLWASGALVGKPASIFTSGAPAGWPPHCSAMLRCAVAMHPSQAVQWAAGCQWCLQLPSIAA
jgi:hypothetical protein